MKLPARWLPVWAAAAAMLAGRGSLAQQIPVRLGGEASSLPGVPFDLPVEVDMSNRSEKLGSFALAVQWNPAILRYVAGRGGNFGQLASKLDSAAGTLNLAGVNPAGVGGRVIVGVGQFVPLSTLGDSLRLTVSELYAAGTFADLLSNATWSNRAYCIAGGRYGDVDGNAVVDSYDALLALTYSVGKSIPGSPALGDVDADGVTGSRDALIILSSAVGLDVSQFRVLTLAPGACSAPPLPALALSPATATLNLGQHVKYLLVATDSMAKALATTEVVWQTSNASVATVTADGELVATGVGTATITANRAGGSATATVVVSQRHTHWVDAFAFPTSENQLGAPELPFRTLLQALAYAAAGDTVRIRSGRYDDGVAINRAVVVLGDTSGGRPRPVLSSQSGVAITVNTAGRVELQALRFDTLGQVTVTNVDTLLVRWAEFRSRRQSVSTASLYVAAAKRVAIERSEFFGAGQYYNGNTGIWLNNAVVARIDSSYVADQGYYGVYVNGLDSAYVRWSRIRNNFGYGVYGSSLSTAKMKAVFSGNDFFQNAYGHVYLTNAAAARFDHNHAVGGGYDGFTVNGDSLTQISLLGDTLDSRDGAWLTLYQFDSLAVDSAVIFSRDGYPYIQGGRAVSVRNSQFLEVTGEALDIYPYPRDTTRVYLRRVEFRGPDSSACDQCGDMIYGDHLIVDADTVQLENFYEGFYVDDSRVALRNVTMHHYGYGAEVDCGSLRVTASTFTDGQYGVEMYGCGSTDSLTVTGSTFDKLASAAIETSDVGAVVTNTQVANSYYGIEFDCGGSLRVSNVSVTGGYYGVYGYGCGPTDTLFVDQSTITGAQYGIYTSSLGAVVTNTTISDADYGLYIYYAPALIQNTQIVRPRSNGVYHYWYSGAGGASNVLNNTVTCDANGASNVGAIYVYRAVVGADTVNVQGNTVNGCRSGLEAYGGSRVTVRGNSVTLPSSPVGTYGLRVDADTAAVIAGNTLTGPASYGSIYLDPVIAARIDSNVVTGAIEAGVHVPGSVDTLLVRDNQIAGVAAAACCISQSSGAIVLDGSAATNRSAQVLRNHITNTTSGIVIARNSGDTVTVLVDSNTVRRADSIGIFVLDYSRALLRKNAVDSTLDGLRFSQFAGTPPAAANLNNITRSRAKGARNTTAAITIDATNNWWNDPAGPACDTSCVGAGDSVSAYVSFTPVLTSPTGAPAPAPPFVAAMRASPAQSLAAPFAVPKAEQWLPAPPAFTAPRRVQSYFLPVIAAAPQAGSADPAAQHMAAVQQLTVERLRQGLAEQAQRLQRRATQREARERQRAAREAARGAAAPADDPAHPRRK